MDAGGIASAPGTNQDLGRCVGAGGLVGLKAPGEHTADMTGFPALIEEATWTLGPGRISEVLADAT